MNKQLQEAQELEAYIDMRKDDIDFIEGMEYWLQQAKANLEKLGCGNEFEIEETTETGVFNAYEECVSNWLCPDCQKAKEIYERIILL